MGKAPKMPIKKNKLKTVTIPPDHDEDFLKDEAKAPIGYSANYETKNAYAYKGLPVHQNKEITKTAVLKSGSQTSIELKKQIKLDDHVQSPYKEIELERFEAAGRKNHAIKAAYAVRKHFMYGKGSELQIILPDEELQLLGKDKAFEKTEKLKENNKDLLTKLEQRDRRLKIEKKMQVITIQAWTFGRGILVKLFDEEMKVIEKMASINSRRLGDPIIDTDNHNSIEGIIVDDQALDIDSCIYATYNEDDLSPHTQGFGYSEIESIADEAETLNILLNEDTKEISKSAWLASILLQIQTAGLDNATAKTKITNIVDAVAKAGKIVGINEEVVAQQMNLEPDFQGLTILVEKLETIIFKTLQVPQFMVQSESAANRATAIQSATQFLNGVVAEDQEWASDLLQEQWYDPFLITNKELLKSDGNDEVEVSETLPFHIRRVWNQAKASEFVDLATSVVALVNAGIWDIQKANEVLGSEEATSRVLKEKKEKQKEMDKMMQIGQQKADSDEEKNKFEKKSIASVANEKKELIKFIKQLATGENNV